MAGVELREVTRDTLRGVLGLAVDATQSQLVAPNAVSIAQAHFEPEAHFRAIYADDVPVGFLLWQNVPEERFTYVWRLMVDARYQGRGHGREAMRLLIERVRSAPGIDAAVLSHADREGNAGPFYRKLGFEYTGEEEDGELMMRLEL
jgi:diamine N-acetyltransferase